MKKIKYEAKGFDDKWNGKYTVSELNALEYIDVEQKFVKKINVNNMGKDVDVGLVKGYMMLKAVKKDGEPLPYNDPKKMLGEMPSKLYLILYGICVQLNDVSREDQRFLSTLS